MTVARIIERSKGMLAITYTGVVANGTLEVLDVLNLVDFAIGSIGLIAVITTGSDATIDVNIQTSINGITFTEQNIVTGENTDDMLPDGTNRLVLPIRYIAVDVDDVGSGNTLSIYVLVTENYPGAEA